MSESTQQLPDVAKKVYVPCKKCEVERYHTVLAHTTSTSAKIECEVCKCKATYKLPSAKKKSATARKTSNSKLAPSSERWQDLKSKSSNTSPYTMRGQFGMDAAIDHPKFGLGFVTAVSAFSIQVLFEDGERALVHNRS